MRAKAEDDIRYYRQYYVLNRTRISARRRIKAALEADGLSKKERVRLENELASTYNTDWAPAASQDPAPAPSASADTPAEPPALLAAPRRKWHLLDGHIYFTSPKGYTADELHLIIAAARAARASRLTTYLPSARTLEARCGPTQVQINYLRWRTKPENAAKSRDRHTADSRKQGRKPRAQALTVQARTLGPRTLWQRDADLVFLNQTHPYTLPQLKDIAASLR